MGTNTPSHPSPLVLGGVTDAPLGLGQEEYEPETVFAFSAGRAKYDHPQLVAIRKTGRDPIADGKIVWPSACDAEACRRYYENPGPVIDMSLDGAKFLTHMAGCKYLVLGDRDFKALRKWPV